MAGLAGQVFCSLEGYPVAQVVRAVHPFLQAPLASPILYIELSSPTSLVAELHAALIIELMIHSLCFIS